MNKRFFVLQVAAAFSCAMLALPVQSADRNPQKTPAQLRAELAKEVPNTIASFRKTDPGIERFFKESHGYVVFPRIGKVAFIIGAGDGTGEAYEGGKLIGTVTLTMASVGLQAGGSDYSEIIFFRDAAALDRMKQNKFEFTANASAVILKAGVAAGVDYRDGIAVFAAPIGGAMVEFSLGSQKFRFRGESAAAKK